MWQFISGAEKERYLRKVQVHNCLYVVSPISTFRVCLVV